ncbi:hypothetical protein MMC14_010606 [Varicellaria rhodocarpa]|nr:hypothetical protein [Varicellaria rhodocarpa]
MACQACFTHEQKLTKAHTHLVTAAALCHWLLVDYINKGQSIDDVMIGSSPTRVDLAGVCGIIYWMLTIQAHIGVGNVFEAKWGPEFLPENLTDSAISKAWESSCKVGICKNRLWSLTRVAELKEVDLPPLVEVAQHCPALRNNGHDNCTAGDCPFNHVNTTLVEQLHKCNTMDRAACSRIRYPVELLEDSINRGMGSVWERHGLHTATGTLPYVAISHVWIDGTGIGIGDRVGIGIVNRCLAEYFFRILDKLHCTGLWWDTISLPTTEGMRKKCIDNMHENYRHALYTVVHGEYLLNVEWAEDGSPCVALVLSSWFTRGWTALELHESKRVKVLYKGPNPDTPLIKDLDDDILAHDPSTTSRGHWIASTIIRRLRQPIESVRDLLSILQPRSTSWPDDRTTIAGLLARLPPATCPQCNEIPMPDTRARIKEHIREHTTRLVLIHTPKICHVSLMHGKPTLSDSGPFSWAPRTLDDMPVESGGDLESDASNPHILTVTQDGSIIGGWYYRFLTRADVQGNLAPLDPKHPQAMLSIGRKWQSYILLREHWLHKGPALLAAAITAGREGATNLVDCRYVGAVNIYEDDNSHGEDYDHRYKYSLIRFGLDLGTEENRPNGIARDVMRSPYSAAVDSNTDSLDDRDGELPEDGQWGWDEIPEDGEEDGWISSDSDGPSRPKGMF